MATLVFDIETTALPLDNFDEAQQEYLFREAEKLGDEIAKGAKREEITKFMSLWPFTSQVVCIAMLNAETQRGQTLFVAEDFEETEEKDAPVKFIPCADEAELLAQFWDAVKNFNSVVTFNGRGFDVPFLYLRSAILNVPISKKNWLGYRYATDPHCDLAEQFTFYSVSGRDGAARRFNLDSVSYTHLNNAVLAVIALVALVALFVARHHFHARKLTGQLALSLIFGGIIGNLTDRLLPGRHAVVDFLHFYLQQRGSYEPLDFPAFNVADSAICTGVALIFLITWKNEHVPKPAESSK